jgi:hypothetical protein
MEDYSEPGVPRRPDPPRVDKVSPRTLCVQMGCMWGWRSLHYYCAHTHTHTHLPVEIPTAPVRRISQGEAQVSKSACRLVWDAPRANRRQAGQVIERASERFPWMDGHPFRPVYPPLSYSGNPGVKRRISQGWALGMGNAVGRGAWAAAPRSSSCFYTAPPSRRTVRSHPFREGTFAPGLLL